MKFEMFCGSPSPTEDIIIKIDEQELDITNVIQVTVDIKAGELNRVHLVLQPDEIIVDTESEVEKAFIKSVAITNDANTKELLKKYQTNREGAIR